MATKKEKNQPISVYARVRPLTKQEISSTNFNVIDVRSNKELQVKTNAFDRHSKSFVFDKVFGPTSKQIDVFKTVAEPTVAEIIAGYNCTIFAYGQTGTGKTYTMAGGQCTEEKPTFQWREDVHTGIIPRTLAYLFDELRIQNIEYTVRVSYLELYNEEIFDLLSPPEDNTKLKLFDDTSRKGSVIVQGLTEIPVNNISEVYKILEKGAEKRRTASTLMNAQSSRSHTIFCVTVHTKESNIDGEDLLKTGKLNLVDLAGSENISKSGVTDKRAREACSINQSLLTLGRVIVTLTEHRAHIPYRESKLTRLLRDSLGGRTKTSLIATISPAFCNLDETLNTLDYASRAKNITNKPEMNQRLTKNALLKEYGDEIERLRRDLQATRLCNGIYLDQENYNNMVKELEIQKEEISEKISSIRALIEERDQKEAIYDELIANKEKHINKLEGQLDEAAGYITELKVTNEYKSFLIEKRTVSEHTLHSTAVKLLDTAENATVDVDKLHKKIEVIDGLNKQNKQVCEQQINNFNSKVNYMQNIINDLGQFHDSYHTNLLQTCADLESKQNNLYKVTEQLLNNLPSFGEVLNNLSEKDQVFQDDLTANINKLNYDFQYLIEENKKELNQKIQLEFLPMVSEVLTTAMEQETITLKSHKRVKNALDAIKRKNLAFTQDLALELQKAKENILGKLEEMADIMSKIPARTLVIALAEEIAMKSREMKFTLIDKIVNTMRSEEWQLFALKRDFSSFVIKKSMDGQNLIENCTATLHTMESDWNDYANCMIDKLVDMNNDISRIFDKERHEITHMFTKYVDITNHLNGFSVDMNWQIDRKYDEYAGMVDNNVSNVTAMVTEHTNDKNKMVEELKKDIEVQHETEVDINEKTKNCWRKHYEMVHRQSEQNLNASAQSQSNLHYELEQCREDFKRLFTSRMQEYKPTGSTPIRKKYKYPKYVPSTRSDDSLLEEYEQSKDSAEVETEEVEIDDEEEDLINNHNDYNREFNSRVLNELSVNEISIDSSDSVEAKKKNVSLKENSIL